MSKIVSFQELQVWKDSRAFASRVYRLTRMNPFAKDFALVDQMRRSTGSIMDNIAEGFERQRNKEFAQFLYIAKGSCGEVQSQLYRAHDAGYIDKDKLSSLIDEAVGIGKQLTGFIHYLKNADMKGSKYVEEPKPHYEVRITNYGPRITNHELQTTNYEC